jgi:hypothetical protein
MEVLQGDVDQVYSQVWLIHESVDSFISYQERGSVNGSLEMGGFCSLALVRGTPPTPPILPLGEKRSGTYTLS